MNIAAKSAAAALLALIGMAGLAGTASAGTWHANAAACPDLREDRSGGRHYPGRVYHREDYLDRQVIDCPAHAWSYYPDRYERGDMRYMASPGRVYVDQSGRYYAVDHHGTAYGINVIIVYPRQNSTPGLRFGTMLQFGDDHAWHDRRDHRVSRDRHGRDDLMRPRRSHH